MNTFVQADDGKTEIDSSQVEVSVGKTTSLKNMPKGTKNIDSCVSRALKLRREKGSEVSVEKTLSTIKAINDSTVLAALPECVNCGQPCVIGGTPCCPGAEDDDCWGVCEGKFPNTYCQ